MNLLITTITNMLFRNLTRDEFVFLSIFFNELSKSMFTTSVFSDLNRRREEEKEIAKEIEKEKEKEEDKEDKDKENQKE